MFKKKNRHLQHWFFLLALSLSPLGLISQTRDYWMKTERKGTGYAFQHITITKLPDGNFRYDYDQHIKTDVAGLNPQEISQTGFYVVDPELRPLSLEIRTKFLAKETHVVGQCTDDIMTLTIQEKDGQPEKRKISFGDVCFDVVLAELIARQAGQKSFRLNIFDPSDIKIDSMQVEILRADDKEIEASVRDLITSQYRIARDGQIQEIRFVELGSRAYRTDAQDAQNITYLNTADGYTLTVRSQKSFPNVFKVSRALLQVRWKNIPFDEFRFEDNRQKIVQKSESDGQFEAVLEMTSPSAPAKDTAGQAPYEHGAAFLSEDDYIKPDDANIRKQAAAVVGETKSPSEIVGKILKWVNTNVVSDFIAETLTGPEVLQKKRGKCSEYAILFASLARAAGIPTRIVLGELYSGGAWMGHMWDEVWLGEWTAVDAAAGMFVAGPSHLKFIDSPTVMGTQGLRWKLTDNLEIEIRDFEQRETQPGLKTGISGSSYVNADYACRISAPDNAWTMKEDAKGGVTTLLMNPQEEGVQFALVFFAVPPGTSAKTILQGRLAGLSKMVRNFKLLEEGEWEIGGEKAPGARFSQTARDQTTIVNQNILLVDGATAYLFAFIAPQEKFSGFGPILKKILSSFEIIK
jgi:hypothetical protein